MLQCLQLFTSVKFLYQGTCKVRGRQFCMRCCREKISLPRISSLWTAINPLRDMLKIKAIPKINNSDFELYDRQLVCLNNWVQLEAERSYKTRCAYKAKHGLYRI